MWPGGQGPHLTHSSRKKSPPPSLAMTKMEDFEHIISYLRDYIAICKEKKRQFLYFSVLLEFENINDTMN